MVYRSMGILIASVLGVGSCFGAPVRTWTSSDGRTLEAELVRVDGDRVVVKRSSDGREFTLRFGMLSADDQAFVQAAGGDEPLPRAAPSRAPDRDAKVYAAAVEALNDAHAKAPGDATEAELASRLPAGAWRALAAALAADGEASGLSDALVVCGEAALDLARARDFGRVRSRLLELDPDAAARLGDAVVRDRFVVRGIGAFEDGYLDRFADVFDAILGAYDEVFGIAEFSKVPGKKMRVRVRLVDEITDPPHFAPQFPYHSEIDFPVVDPGDFRSPTLKGQFLFYGLCHELGHVVAMWGTPETMEDHHAWAHYTGLAIVEHFAALPDPPGFMKRVRDAEWRSFAKEREAIAGAKPSVDDRDGMIALLLALHDSAGPEAIGRAINAMDANGSAARVNRVRYYRLADFREAMGKVSPMAVEACWP